MRATNWEIWEREREKQGERDIELYKRYEKGKGKPNDPIKQLTPLQKKLYLETNIQRLINRFFYIYNVLCNKKMIDFKGSIEKSKHTSAYDADIITVLWMIEKIYKSDNGKRIKYWELLSARGLAIDGTRLGFYKGLLSKSKRKYFIHHKRHKDYKDYLDSGNEKRFHNNGSFSHCKGTQQRYLDKNFIPFLEVMLERIDEFSFNKGNGFYYSSRETKILNEFDKGFKSFINRLDLPIIKKKDENNIDAIIRLNRRRKRQVEMPFFYTGEHEGEKTIFYGLIDLLPPYIGIIRKEFGLE